MTSEQNDFIEQEVARRTREALDDAAQHAVNHALRQAMQETVAVQDVIILAVTTLAETGDSDTGNRIPRIQHYVRALALAVKNHSRFTQELTDEHIDLLFKFAPLHDIG